MDFRWTIFSEWSVNYLKESTINFIEIEGKNESSFFFSFFFF
jgi:hypothetical protein